MDERDFELLSVLAMTGNITHTANKLYVTQSALSKRIAALEQSLGITLLVRSRQGVHLTPEGEMVLARTAEAANQLQLMRSAIEAGKGQVSGTLKVGVSVNYAQFRLPDILKDYLAQYPLVKTHVTTDHSRRLFTRLLDGRFDVAILRGEFPWPGNRLLIEEEPICVIRNGADLKKPLETIPYIGRRTDMVFEREVIQWMRENGIRPGENRVFVDNIMACVALVSRGAGWAIVPEICLSGFQGDVRPIRFADSRPFVRSTYLMYTDTARDLPQVKAFVELAGRYANQNSVQEEGGKIEV